VWQVLDDVRRSELEDVVKMTAVLRDKLDQVNQLKENWYEPELARLTRAVSEAETLRQSWYEPELARRQGELDKVLRELNDINTFWIRKLYLYYNSLYSKFSTFTRLLNRGDYQGILQRARRNLRLVAGRRLGRSKAQSNPLLALPSGAENLIPSYPLDSLD
jgi:hypothetical protein